MSEYLQQETWLRPAGALEDRKRHQTHRAGLCVFRTRFFWIRVLTEDQAVYLLPGSGCGGTRQREWAQTAEDGGKQDDTLKALTTVKDLSQRG